MSAAAPAILFAHAGESHVGGGPGGGADAGGGELLGSPLYDVLPEHALALIAAALVPLAVLWIRRRGNSGAPRAEALLRGYRRLPLVLRLTTWALLLSAAVHAGLFIGHPASAATPFYLLAALVMLVVARRLVKGERWRLAAALVLGGSILAYAATRFAGDHPDQVGMVTKLVELAALGVVLTPEPGRRVWRLAGSTTLVSLVVLTGISAWAGAFVVAAGSGDGHHGPVPMPGSLVRHEQERKPTAAERAAADTFYERAVAGLAAYEDPAAAAADGYQVEGLAGTDFHAANPAYAADGKVFKPTRPESLVYADTPTGPVLLGAVYELQGLDDRGPAIGGPLTQWHSHENVCIAVGTFGLSGLMSPYGSCPPGSINVPLTPEMIHIWVVPGAPQRFGDLDQEWLADYLSSRGA